MACVHIFWRTDVRPVRLSVADSSGFAIHTPMKAHLADGSTVVFVAGAQVSPSRVSGVARRFALLAADAEGSAREMSVPVDSILGLETFEEHVREGTTVVVSAASTAVVAVGTAALYKALYGSCPTVYTLTDSGAVLEAEGFSYAIAPLLEHRDVDALRVQPDAAGVIRLELRNEALETHFLNHIELAAAQVGATDVAVPDQRGRIVGVDGFRPTRSATDRAGRDVRAMLELADGAVFETEPGTLAASTVNDLDDWIDVSVDSLPPGDSVAVVLRLRNSLLNTVLLYNGMLSGPDAADWMTTTMQGPLNVLELASWYRRTMGMRATVRGVNASSAPEQPSGQARLADVGPLAFRDVALVLARPVRNATTISVRLRFVVDNWRIDHVRVGGVIERPTITMVPLARVTVTPHNSSNAVLVDPAAVQALSTADENRLETRPGQRMTLEFDTPRPGPGSSQSQTRPHARYFIAWQGWYREWLRPAWLLAKDRAAPFMPGDSAAFTAIVQWRERKVEFERAFYASRIPVR